MRGEARITIAAPAGHVWALVSDVTRIPEWSPECYKVHWLDGATGPAVGARFRGWNKKGPFRWATNPKVTECEPGRVFAFDTGTTRWRYEFKALPGGVAEVTESYETHRLPGYDFVLTVTRRGPQLDAGMQKTLARLKAAAEAESR